MKLHLNKIVLMIIVMNSYSSLLPAAQSQKSTWGFITSFWDTAVENMSDKRVPLDPYLQEMTTLQKQLRAAADKYRQLPMLSELMQQDDIRKAKRDFNSLLLSEDRDKIQTSIDHIKKFSLALLAKRDESLSQEIESLLEIRTQLDGMSLSSSVVMADQKALAHANAQNEILRHRVSDLIQQLEDSRSELADKKISIIEEDGIAWDRVKAAKAEAKNSEAADKRQAEQTRIQTWQAGDEGVRGRFVEFYAGRLINGIRSGIPGDAQCIKWFSRITAGVMQTVGLEAAGTAKMAGQAASNETRRIAREAGNELRKSARKAGDEYGASVRRHLEKGAGKAVEAVTRESKILVRDVGGQAVLLGTVGFAALAAITVATFAGYKGVALGMRLLDERLRKPSVIEETNIPEFNKFIKNRVRSFFGKEYVEVKEHVYPLLSDVVVDGETAQEFDTLKFEINTAKETKSIFRNLLLWGYPGTGKTMSAQALAHETDCYWVLMTGSSLFKMAPEKALQEVDAIFKFAQGQEKPTMIIFDEADTLFRSRENVSEGTLKVMTHIMQKIGTESDKFIVVAITNKPSAFDEAMQSRFPIKMEVKLPGLEQRKAIIKKYIDREFTQRHLDTSAFDDEQFINWMALETKGFVGRDLMFLIAGIRGAYTYSKGKTLTQDFVRPLISKELERRAKKAAGFTREALVS